MHWSNNVVQVISYSVRVKMEPRWSTVLNDYLNMFSDVFWNFIRMEAYLFAPDPWIFVICINPLKLSSYCSYHQLSH
jgi:hypothetical protein